MQRSWKYASRAQTKEVGSARPEQGWHYWGSVAGHDSSIGQIMGIAVYIDGIASGLPVILDYSDYAQDIYLHFVSLEYEPSNTVPIPSPSTVFSI